MGETSEALEDSALQVLRHPQWSLISYAGAKKGQEWCISCSEYPTLVLSHR